MRKEFAVHRLNDAGMAKAVSIAEHFSELLIGLEGICALDVNDRGDGAREMAIVRTKLEEAAFFAKKAMAVQKGNQS